MNTPLKPVGFTLIELLITLSILSLLVSVALPSMNGIIAKNRTDSVINEIESFFRLGRTEAINENKIVVACPSSNGTSCSRDWTQSWILFADPNRNYVIDKSEILIKKLDLDFSDLMIQTKPAKRGNFRWQPLGITHGAPGSIIVCHPKFLESNRKLTVSMLGRVRLSRDSDDDGIHEDKKGKDLKCA